MKKVSDKRRRQLSEYTKIKKEYLKLRPYCECGTRGCSRVADQIHHKRGRENERLLDKKYFLAVCGNCHRWIEDHPEWARAHGFSLERNN